MVSCSRFLFLLLVTITISVYTVDSIVCEHDVSIRNLNALAKIKHCRVINGSLDISFILSMYHVRTNIAKFQFHFISLPKLEIITGCLIMFHVPGLHSIGQLFPNLRAVRGLELFKGIYAIVLYDMPNLREVST